MIKEQHIKGKKIPKKMMLIPLYPFIKLFYWIKMIMTPPIRRPGIHVITGDTGSGKTLIASILSKRFHDKGWTVVSNSQFNSIIKKIKLDDYFNNFEIIKPLENCIAMFDEIQREFNKRMNRRNDYNQIFIPLIEWLTTHRHNGVPMVYFITQSFDLLDTQLQSLIQKVHFVMGKKSTSLKSWLRDEKIKPIIVPKKIQYYTKKRKDILQDDIQKYVNRKNELRYKKIKPSIIKVDLKQFIDYNTFAFKRLNFEKDKTDKKEG